MARPRTFVIHWHPDELATKVRTVEEAGGDVVGSEDKDGARAASRAQALDIDALVIWLSRLPSHGRMTAAAIRSSAWGRKLPILFVDGDPESLDPENLARVKAALPDALLVTPASLRLWLGKVADLKAKSQVAT